MNVFAKLLDIRDIIQQDVGNRGLARDPTDNLINACPDDFGDACGLIAATPKPSLLLVTGFHIANSVPPASETDGPLGAVFLARTFCAHGFGLQMLTDGTAMSAIAAGLEKVGIGDSLHPQVLADSEVTYQPPLPDIRQLTRDERKRHLEEYRKKREDLPTCRIDQIIAIERVGPSLKDGRCYSMRGVDISAQTRPAHSLFDRTNTLDTIGIGDGGNEIGMGKIPHETIIKNIPNGDLIHCRVATDQLIVAGVSNWGAYALAAGVALLRGVQLPDQLFDPDLEREILEVMVREGPLVDGVTGKQTATVDGLSWDDYIKPLVEIGKIVRA
jgi:hypothetical protein